MHYLTHIEDATSTRARTHAHTHTLVLVLPLSELATWPPFRG